MSNNYNILPDPILEKTTPEITGIIKDEDGTLISSADLDTVTLTLFNLSDAPTCTIINSRTAQNVLNTNNVTIDTSGNLVWSVQPLDTAILGTGSIENHRAVFEWTYNSGSKNGKHIIDMVIRNLIKTT